MAHFDPVRIGDGNGQPHFFNLDLVTDYRYIPDKNVTQIGVAGEDSYRVIKGNVIDQLIEKTATCGPNELSDF